MPDEAEMIEVNSAEDIICHALARQLKASLPLSFDIFSNTETAEKIIDDLKAMNRNAKILDWGKTCLPDYENKTIVLDDLRLHFNRVTGYEDFQGAWMLKG